MRKHYRFHKRTKIFRKRSRLVRDWAESHLRSIHAFRQNWRLKHEDYLLPKADGIFDFLENTIRNIYSMKEECVGASEWEEIHQDEPTLERDVQALLTALNWIYWQRLEGYETADVSTMREVSFEDIGGIQQLYIAADALIEDYKSNFSFELPYDFLSVFGLHPSIRVTVPFFISAPRYAKYGFFPSWILFSHEIAHVAIDWIEERYVEWEEYIKYMKMKRVEWELKKGRNQIFIEEYKREFKALGLESEMILEFDKMRIEHQEDYFSDELDKRGTAILYDIKECAERVFSNMKSVLSSYEIDNENSDFLKRIDEISSILGNVENLDYGDFLSRYEKILKHWDDFAEKSKFMETPAAEALRILANELNDTINAYKELYEKPKKIMKGLEGIRNKLPGSSEFQKLEYFFEKWKEIRDRAFGIAELMLRLAGGNTGRRYLRRSIPELHPHEEIAIELICDIIATFLSGEYYIYSFFFYKFMPTLKISKEKEIRPAKADPMILRLFVCLETLRETVPELEKLIDYLSIKYLYSPRILDTFGEEIIRYLKNEGVLKDIESYPSLDMKKISGELLKVVDERINDQKNIMEVLLDEIMQEENEIKKSYLDSQKSSELGSEDRLANRFFYIGNVLQEDIRLLLREGSPNPEKFRDPNKEGVSTEESALKQLINLVGEYLIKDEGKFYNVDEDYKEIEQIKNLSKCLEEGNILLNLDGKKYENIEPEYITPKYIISAFCYSYFMDELTKDNPEFTFFKAFNSTILSMTWSRKALDRFSL